MPGSYERVSGSGVGPLADREATRSALEAGHPGVGDLRGRGEEEKAFVRGCSLSCHRCWVLLPPPRVWCVTRGRCAKGVVRGAQPYLGARTVMVVLVRR